MAENTFKCEYCDKWYVSLLNKPYKTHVSTNKITFQNEHPIENSRFKCVYCEKTWKSSDSIPYHTHLNAFHGEKVVKEKKIQMNYLLIQISC